MFNKVYEIIWDMQDKRLIRGEYAGYIDGTPCHCAIGAVLAGSGGPMPTRNDGLIGSVLDHEPEVRDALSWLGLTWQEADDLQAVNDEGFGSAEERYEQVLAWLKKKVECSS